MIGFDEVIGALNYESFGSRTYRVGTNVEYSVYVEFGTSRNEAQPYLRPAVEQAVSELDQIANSADSPEELVETLALKIEEYAKDKAPVDTGTLQASIEAQRVA